MDLDFGEEVRAENINLGFISIELWMQTENRREIPLSGRQNTRKGVLDGVVR